MGPEPVAFSGEAGLKESTLVVGWTGDSGRTGRGVAEYLIDKLGCRPSAEIDPTAYFPLNGVSIEGDIARLPGSIFYMCQDKAVAVFLSDPPSWEWHDFLGAVLDVAQRHCRARRIIVVGGMVTFAPHTAPRHSLLVSNSPEMARDLSGFNIAGMDYETQAGQRPTMSSYLLWMANRRNIPAASIWMAVPFYLAAHEDPASWERFIRFFNDLTGAGVDLSGVGAQASELNRRVAEAATMDPDLDAAVHKLESGIALGQEESEKLAQTVGEALRRRR